MTENIIIFDTTLRDGEQAAGATMTLNEKMAIAELLDQMEVDVIEAGFAIASEGDFKAINEIAKNIKNATICSLARAIRKDIEKAAQALKPCQKGRIHTFISTSTIHLKYQMRKTEKDVLETITDTVSFARNLCADVEWSAMDASRSSRDFLYQAIENAIKSGARTINVPDTVGYAIPNEYSGLIKDIKNNVVNIDQAIVSVHCHNDLGLATANSLEALNGGARQIECTINGIGERAGNTAMEEVVMALKTRGDLLQYKTNIKTEYFARISKLVSASSGFIVQNNKAIVGANAFAHESGIHQDGMLKNKATYEIITPESVGFGESKLVLGKHSGRHAFKKRLEELNYKIESDIELDKYFKKFKDLADHKKEIFDEDIISLIGVLDDKKGFLEFSSLAINYQTNAVVAELALLVNGEKKQIKAKGAGTMDAIFQAIKDLVPHQARLNLYQVQSITGGIDAQAEVTVRLEKDDGTIYTGHSSNIDTLIASANAYIYALNKLLNDKNILAQVNVVL